MSVKVFVSSTCSDLELDCRPCVIGLIEGIAEAIAMELWDSPFKEARVVCRDKLEFESSHYLGLFAHRFGAKPPGSERSYTQYEFEWARELEKEMAVFVPKPATPFDNILRKRAKTQTSEDALRQKEFVKSVRELGVVNPFDDLMQLAKKATRLVNQWSGKGVMDHGAATPSRSGVRTAARANHDRHPVETDYLALGRSDFGPQLRRLFDFMAGAGMAEVAGFLVWGQTGAGHDQAIRLLQAEFAEMNRDTEPRRILLPVGARHEGPHLAGLLTAFGREVEEGWEPKTVKALADRLNLLLSESPVVLEINNLQRYDGGLAAFVKDFWKPLTGEMVGELYQNQLAAFMKFEGMLKPAWKANLFDASVERDLVFKASKSSKLIKLPELRKFTEPELTAWLRAWLKKKKACGGDLDKQLNCAKAEAKTLIKETAGEPSKVYLQLNKLDVL
jgi:hypothetical protein